MTFEQFKYFLDAYGADLARWPAEQRAEARSFLASSQAATAALAEARRLDAALDLIESPRDELAERRLVARVMARTGRPAERDRREFFDWLLGPLWSRAAIVAAMAVLAVVTGVVAVEQPAAEGRGVVDYFQGPSDGGAIELADL